MGYCSATYYSTEIRSVPATCALCSDPTDLDCLKKWSKCVKKQDKATHGRVRFPVTAQYLAIMLY